MKILWIIRQDFTLILELYPVLNEIDFFDNKNYRLCHRQIKGPISEYLLMKESIHFKTWQYKNVDRCWYVKEK